MKTILPSVGGAEPPVGVEDERGIGAAHQIVEKDAPGAVHFPIDLAGGRNLDDVEDAEEEETPESDLPERSLGKEERHHQVAGNLVEDEVTGVLVLPVGDGPGRKPMIRGRNNHKTNPDAPHAPGEGK